MSATVDVNIASRKSIFAFSPKKIKEEKLNLIFDAARRAPSGFNNQPWRYIYAVKGEEAYNELFSLLTDGNKTWASSAPVLILGISEVFDTRRNAINRTAIHDLGLSTAMLLMQAQSLGLSSHVMGGFDLVRAREVFGIPAEFEPFTMMALGYEGDPSFLPADLAKRHSAPRTRKEIPDFAFRGKWKTQN